MDTENVEDFLVEGSEPGDAFDRLMAEEAEHTDTLPPQFEDLLYEECRDRKSEAYLRQRRERLGDQGKRGEVG